MRATLKEIVPANWYLHEVLENNCYVVLSEFVKCLLVYFRNLCRLLMKTLRKMQQEKEIE